MECTAVQIRSRFFTLENKKFRLLLLFLIMGAGAVFAFSGIQWGLPMRLHPDEKTIVDVAMEMAAAGTYEPIAYFRPDHLLIKLDTLLYQVYASLTGQSIASLIQNTPEVFCLIARALTAAFGVACIPLAYGIGCKHKPATGLIAAALFAIFPLYVLHSHYATSDVPTVFMTLGLIYAAISYFQKPCWVWLAGMSLFVAMFVTIKYPGLVMLSVVAIAVVFVGIRTKQIKRMMLHGFAAIGLFLGITFLISPELFTKFDLVVNALLYESRTEHLGADGLGFIGNFLYYWQEYITAGSFILLGFSVLGGVAVARMKKLFWLPLCFGFIYWICISMLALHWQRWGLPMLVSPLLLSAFGVHAAWEWISCVTKRAPRITVKVIFFAAVAFMVCNLTVASAAHVMLHRAPDTRMLGKDFCEQNGITTRNAMAEGYTPSRPSAPNKIFKYFEWDDEGRLLLRKPRRYVILSSYLYDRYRAEPERYAEENAIYDAIERQGVLLAEFYPEVGVSQGWSAIENIKQNWMMIGRVAEGKVSGPALKIFAWDDHAPEIE